MRYIAVLLAVALCTGCGSGAKGTRQLSEVVYETGSVDGVCGAMNDSGFKSVRGIACGGETPVVDRIKVGDVTFKGIRYTGGAFKDRYVKAEVTDAAGKPISKLDELKLALDGKIPLAVIGGGWLPPKSYDFDDFKKSKPVGMEVVSTKFLYDTTGAKVEKVGEWKGFPMYHVTHEGMASYFAVEAAGGKVTCYPYE